MYAKKLKLENDIYFRAACLGVTVAGVRGRLRTLSTDAYLNALIRVYNRFFGIENQASSPIEDGIYLSFKKQQTCLPVLKQKGNVALFACDFPAILASWQGRGPSFSE